MGIGGGTMTALDIISIVKQLALKLGVGADLSSLEALSFGGLLNRDVDSFLEKLETDISEKPDNDWFGMNVISPIDETRSVVDSILDLVEALQTAIDALATQSWHVANVSNPINTLIGLVSTKPALLDITNWLTSNVVNLLSDIPNTSWIASWVPVVGFYTNFWTTLPRIIQMIVLLQNDNTFVLNDVESLEVQKSATEFMTNLSVAMKHAEIV